MVPIEPCTVHTENGMGVHVLLTCSNHARAENVVSIVDFQRLATIIVLIAGLANTICARVPSFSPEPAQSTGASYFQASCRAYSTHSASRIHLTAGDSSNIYFN